MDELTQRENRELLFTHEYLETKAEIQNIKHPGYTMDMYLHADGYYIGLEYNSKMITNSNRMTLMEAHLYVDTCERMLTLFVKKVTHNHNKCPLIIKDNLYIYTCGNTYDTELKKYYCICANECVNAFNTIDNLCSNCDDKQCRECQDCTYDNINAVTETCNFHGEPDNI